VKPEHQKDEFKINYHSAPISKNNWTHLFSKVICFGAVGVRPAAAETLAEHGVVGFLEALGLLVEAREVPAHHHLHAREGVLFSHGLRQQVHVVVRVAQFVEERARL
jgi:hypothetical protein